MKAKKIAGIAAVSIIIILVAEILGYITAYTRIIYGYIAVFTDNRDDFEYVAGVMKKWEGFSYIAYDYRGSHTDFNDCVSSNKTELESEMINDQQFYDSLKNIYELYKIRNIWVYEDCIEFSFRKILRGHYCEIVYGEDIKECSCRYIIDENWALELSPDRHRHDYEK